MKNALIVALAGLTLTVPALAQDSKPISVVVPNPAPPAAMPAPVWTEQELQDVAKLFVGSWRSTAPVPTGVGDSASVLWLNAAPVFIPDLPNSVYAEVAREDAPQAPFRQVIWNFSRVNGKVRLTTFEFRRSNGYLRSVTGLWAAPSVFPLVTRSADLVATLAFDFTGSNGSYEAATPHPYPTGMGGAAEMTGQFKISAGKFDTADRGFDAGGKQVWGPAAGQWTSFTTAPSPVKAEEFEPGLWKLSYPAEVTGEGAKQGDTVSCHYAGYLAEGRLFDSSYERSAPFVYTNGQPLIEGWNKVMTSPKAGEKLRLIVPAHLAYGERGRPGRIPPNSALFYDITIASVEAPAPAPAPTEAPKADVKLEAPKEVAPK